VDLESRRAACVVLMLRESSPAALDVHGLWEVNGRQRRAEGAVEEESSGRQWRVPWVVVSRVGGDR
jgi:hypothetical protein